MKKWEKPLVISLYRGKPEEHVLCGCKFTSSGTNPGTNNNLHCDKKPYSYCQQCSSGTAS